MRFLLPVMLFAVLMLSGCGATSYVVGIGTENVLPLLSDGQRAEYRGALGELTESYDAKYNLDGTLKLEEPEQPEDPEEPTAE